MSEGDIFTPYSWPALQHRRLADHRRDAAKERMSRRRPSVHRVCRLHPAPRISQVLPINEQPQVILGVVPLSARHKDRLRRVTSASALTKEVPALPPLTKRFARHSSAAGCPWWTGQTRCSSSQSCNMLQPCDYESACISQHVMSRTAPCDRITAKHDFWFPASASTRDRSGSWPHRDAARWRVDSRVTSKPKGETSLCARSAVSSDARFAASTPAGRRNTWRWKGA